jgi:hypothetical protein
LVDTALGERSEGSLLIFLDDLDRCLPDSVVKLLEGVKLLLCGRDDCRVIFVFGLDRQIVGEAIAQRYPTSSSYSGESYLEKIFDLSLEIPSPSSQQIQALIARAWPDSLARAVAAVFEPFGGSGLVSQVLADPVFANPRIIKRVLNRLALFARCSQAKAFLSRLTTEPDRRRFLTWTAGAERFRGFRYGFMAATSGEIEGLHAFVASGDDRQLVGRMSMIARAPGFRRYYMLLGLEGHDWMSVDRQRNATGAGQLGAPALSLRDFDDVLRGVGL